MREFVESIIGSIGYSGVALLTFLENIFPPIPSEVIIPLAGFTAQTTDMTLWGVILAGTFGTAIGAIPFYLLGVYIGEERVMRWADRYGKYLLISSDDVQRADKWLQQYGTFAVFICRLVPGLRTIISVPAGIAKMPFGVFMIWTTLGTLLWTLILAVLGYILGAQYTLIQPYLNVFGWIVMLGIIAYMGWQLYKRVNKNHATH